MVISNDIEIKCDVRTRNLKWTMKTIKQHLTCRNESGNMSLIKAKFIPWDFLLIKKLEIEKTQTTFVISALKVVY